MPRVPSPRRSPRRSLVVRVRDNVPDNGETRRHYVVCGNDPLAYRLVEELVRAYRVPVTVVLAPWRRGDGPEIAELPGVRVIRVKRVDEQALRAARVETAAALALVQQDDVGNIHTALLAREVNPGVRLVVRMFNVRLGEGIQRLFPQHPPSVLSDADIAAPEFVAVALGEVDPNTVQLPGRTLFVARRADVSALDVVCALADTSVQNRPVLLPAAESTADLVLASTDPRGPASANPPTQAAVRARHRRRPFSTVLRGLRGIVSRKLQIAIFTLIGVVAVVGAALALVSGKGLWKAVYTTLLTTVSGSAEQTNDARVEVLQLLMVVAGLALIPVLTAAVVEGLVNARLAAVRGQLQAPMEDHVVVIGLGNVGTRVIRELHDLGIDVVAIDKNESARGALLANELSIPLIIGDASQSETLHAACVQHCRALVVLSTDDVTNLEAALHARAVNPGLRVVLRLFDGDFAERVQRAFDIAFSRSVSYLAAPAFAAAMMRQEVVQTIPIERHVLLIADIPVGAGSSLEGVSVAGVNVPNEAAVIALTRFGEPRPLWTPGRHERLARNDRITVVATRSGLNRLLERAAGPPEEPASVGEPANVGTRELGRAQPS